MKRILCYGDSNTWGSTAEGTRFPEDVRWTGVLAAAGYRVIEEGYNGRTTVFDDPVEGRLSGIAYFETCLDSQSPLDLVILMLGTNDLKVRFGVEAQAIAHGFKRYQRALQSVPMAGERPGVLLISPIEIDASYKRHPLFYGMFGEDAVARSRALRSAYRDFAREAGWSHLNAARFAAAVPEDGIHMDAAGHAALGAAIAARVRGLLG